MAGQASPSQGTAAPSGTDSSSSNLSQITPAPAPQDLTSLVKQIQSDPLAAAALRQVLGPAPSGSSLFSKGPAVPTVIAYQWDPSAFNDSNTQRHFASRGMHIPAYVYDYVRLGHIPPLWCLAPDNLSFDFASTNSPKFPPKSTDATLPMTPDLDLVGREWEVAYSSLIYLLRDHSLRPHEKDLPFNKTLAWALDNHYEQCKLKKEFGMRDEVGFMAIKLYDLTCRQRLIDSARIGTFSITKWHGDIWETSLVQAKLDCGMTSPQQSIRFPARLEHLDHRAQSPQRGYSTSAPPVPRPHSTSYPSNSATSTRRQTDPPPYSRAPSIPNRPFSAGGPTTAAVGFASPCLRCGSREHKTFHCPELHCIACGSFSQRYRSCSNPRIAIREGANLAIDGKRLCLFYQHGECDSHQCRWLHLCSLCGGRDHMASVCHLSYNNK